MRSEIYGLIRQAVAGGMAAIVVASDFEELARVSDRVVILRDGVVTGELHHPDISAAAIMRAVNRKAKETK